MDSLTAMLKTIQNLFNPWLKLLIQTLSGPRIKHILKK